MMQQKTSHRVTHSRVTAAAMIQILLSVASLVLLTGFEFGDLSMQQHTLSDALAFRDTLLEREIVMRFDAGPSSPSPLDYHLKMQDHPEWILFDGDTRTFSLDSHRIREFLSSHDVLRRPVIGMARAPEDEGWVTRASVVQIPKEGWTIDESYAASVIAKALEQGVPERSIATQYTSAQMFLQTDSDIIVLTRLSQGLSDFSGSPLGRGANVRKALNERLQGIVIEPGSTFSFNRAMKDSGGWSEALIIAEGGTLVPEPGGGICQAATTAFRAAVLAGLPIEKRANHSLYVKYYEEHGVGIDATVYPDKQDFTFQNDTEQSLVMVSRSEGDTAVVELYGVPDGRTVNIDGPFFAKTGAEELTERGHVLRINQIGWTYDISYPDGRDVQSAIISTYKAIPKTLPETYASKPLALMSSTSL